MKNILFALLTFIIFHLEMAQAQSPRVGRKEAAKYFSSDLEPSSETASRAPSSAGGDRLLMLHIGAYSQSASYNWKDSDKRQGVGKATYGVTYLYDQWSGIDVNIRFDFNEYKIDDESATKLSAMPLWTFPMSESRFPLYFGAGVGAGVFFTQLPEESNISFDYQLIAGARFMDLIENFGAFVEFGLKNHLHLLSDGQFNGTAWSAGAVFTF
ncbi:MAG: hypothetical protein ACAH59_06535 [Pseudobdellovibrionaceae bacterium]